MKRHSGIILAALCCIWLSGCVRSALTVSTNKAPTKPFSRIMIIYIDEACDFRPFDTTTFAFAFDSTTYNICLRNNFRNESKMEVRRTVERLLATEMPSTITTVFNSSDFFNGKINSYTEYRQKLADLKIDAILLINFSEYSHSSDYGHNILPKFTTFGYGSVNYKHASQNPGYECYLIPPKEGSAPIWEAQLEIKGRSRAPKYGLTRDMAEMIARNLEHNGYRGH